MMNTDIQHRLVAFLSRYVSENKRKLILEKIRHRTRHITAVMEDIYQPQNASAVIRTCDCLGIQDIYVFENQNRYRLNPDVSLGSAKWVQLHRSTGMSIDQLYQELRQKGYLMAATTPHKEGCIPEEIPLDRKVAFVFGRELEGLSGDAIQAADLYVNIPMFGFTESYNISVSAAIILYTVIRRMKASDVKWELQGEEEDEVQLFWLRNIIKRADLLEKEFFRQ